MRQVYITLLLLAVAYSVPAQIKPRVDSVVVNHINLRLPTPSFNARDVQVKVQKVVTDSLLAIKNFVASPLLNLAKSPVVFNKAEVSYEGSLDNNYMGSNAYLSNVNLGIEGSVMGVPLQIVNRNGNWFDQSSENFSFRFDRAAYLKQLEAGYSKKIDKQKLLSAVSDPFAQFKQQAQGALSQQLGQINNQYQNLLTDDIKGLGNFEDVLKMDMSALRNRFMESTQLSKLGEQQALFEQLKSRMDLGERIDTAQFNAVLNQIRRGEGLKQMLGSIETLKKQWQSSGLIRQMKDFEGLKQASLEKLMTEPSTVLGMARKELNLNSFQRFFLKVDKLNFGQSALNSSALSFQNFLNSGGMTELKNKGKSLMLLMGKTQNGASITDLPFSNSVFSNAVAKAVQLGKATKSGDVHLSFASFQEGYNTVGNLAGLNRLRQSFVTSLSKEFSFGKYSSVTTEVSRSVASYNTKTSDQPSGVQKMFSSENLSSNTSVHLTYHDEYPGIGLAYQVQVKKTGLGYDNPGNPFLNTGSQEAGINVRKSFLDRRLQVMVRTDVREFNYAEASGEKWRNIYSVFDVKWKLDRSNTISLRYLPNRMLRYDAQGKHPATTLDYLSFDGNFNKRISGMYYNSYASLLYQKNQFASGLLSYEANNVGLTLNQSLALRKMVVFWNTQLNRSQNNSQLVYLNSSVNSELGSSLTVLKLVSLSTSFSYNSIDEWYKQVGLRETLDVLVSRRMSVSGFIDVRKNLQLYQPLIFGLVTGSVRVHYSFK